MAAVEREGRSKPNHPSPANTFNFGTSYRTETFELLSLVNRHLANKLLELKRLQLRNPSYNRTPRGLEPFQTPQSSGLAFLCTTPIYLYPVKELRQKSYYFFSRFSLDLLPCSSYPFRVLSQVDPPISEQIFGLTKYWINASYLNVLKIWYFGRREVPRSVLTVVTAMATNMEFWGNRTPGGWGFDSLYPTNQTRINWHFIYFSALHFSGL